MGSLRWLSLYVLFLYGREGGSMAALTPHSPVPPSWIRYFCNSQYVSLISKVIPDIFSKSPSRFISHIIFVNSKFEKPTFRGKLEMSNPYSVTCTGYKLSVTPDTACTSNRHTCSRNMLLDTH